MESNWSKVLMQPRYSKQNQKSTRNATKEISGETMDDLLAIKHEREQWSQSRVPLFRNIGFAVSFFIMIVAFNWKTYDNADLVSLGELELDAEEIIDIPISEQPPPPPPKKIETFVIQEVKDTEEVEDVLVELDVEVSEETVLEEIEYVLAEEEPEETTDEVFTIVEEPAQPVGGPSAFNKYLAENLNYPPAAARLNVSGRVFVQFTVEKDGRLTDLTVMKGIGAGCDEEALRVVGNAPNWKPGKQRGMPVRVRMIVPILFKLQTL